MSKRTMMVATLPIKVWDKFVDVMHDFNDAEIEENAKQRHLGFLVGLFNEWEREVIADQKIRYGEMYYGWDHDALVDLKVSIRNKRDELEELERAAKFLPEDKIAEYDDIKV